MLIRKVRDLDVLLLLPLLVAEKTRVSQHHFNISHHLYSFSSIFFVASDIDYMVCGEWS